MTVSVSEVFNAIQFDDEEVSCLLHFIENARECGYPSANEPYYRTIDTIFLKYYEQLNKLDQNCTFHQYDY